MSDVPALGLNVAVVIVNYRTPHLVASCLASISGERNQLPSLRVIVVDGGSGDDSVLRLDEIAKCPDFCDWVNVLPLPINGGFGWANNQAFIGLFQGTDPPIYVHLLNPDTTIEPGAIVKLVRFLQRHAGVGAVGSQLVDEHGSTTGCAFPFPTLRGEFARGARTGFIDRLLNVTPSFTELQKPREVDWVTGASVMLRTAALHQSGLFDDGFFLYHEEVELMWRLRQRGWSIWHEPASRVVHFEGASTGVYRGNQVNGRQLRRPSYWYQSRRRLFARIYGAGSACAAGWFWVMGHLVFRLRRAIGLGGVLQIEHEFRDHCRLALFPTKHDCTNAVRPWNFRSGEQPAWMNFDS